MMLMHHLLNQQNTINDYVSDFMRNVVEIKPGKLDWPKLYKRRVKIKHNLYDREYKPLLLNLWKL